MQNAVAENDVERTGLERKVECGTLRDRVIGQAFQLEPHLHSLYRFFRQIYAGVHAAARNDRFRIGKYLSMENFIHANTDGPGNPYSKVYDLKGVREDFPEFEVSKSYQCFMHAPPLKVAWLPLASSLGWHLWVQMRKR